MTTGFLCTDPGKDLTLLRFVRLCFAQGPRAAQMLGDPDAAAAFALERAVDNEACRLIEFIRFEERDGMLGAVIHPRHRILPLLRGHFCSRLPDESFLIYDAAHGTALLMARCAIWRWSAIFPAPTRQSSTGSGCGNGSLRR